MTLEWPKWLAMGSKKGSFHLFMHPKWSRIIFGKTHFGKGGPQAQNAPTTLVLHSMWSKIFFEKSPFFFFCIRRTLLTHVGTHLFGLPIAACRGPLGLGTGVKALVGAILRGGNQHKWVVAGGLDALEFGFGAT